MVKVKKKKKRAVVAEKLFKEYRTGSVVTKVLKGIDIYVECGDFVAITGKSGSGKSTLLYQLGLLDVPSGGRVVIDGRDTADLCEAERSLFRLKKLGYVFQDYALLPSLTALENVLVPLKMLGYDNGEAVVKAKKALDLVDLSDRYHYRPGQLSGGQQQRVSIARAIGNEPDILFADEPTANLDSVVSRVIMDVLKDIHKRGQTIVLITHDPDFVKLADVELKLVDGRFS
jgi:putative ABC transport system ATP-binding protein